MPRLGGKGLSLEAFAGAKGKQQHNPAELKRKRERYQNAKKVQQYKKLKKDLGVSSITQASEERQEDTNTLHNTENSSQTKESEGRTRGFKRRKGFSSLGKIRNEQEKKEIEAQKAREEKEKQRAEQKLVREQAERIRKETKIKMFKKTSRGQPLMRHRLEGILSKVTQS